MSLINELDLAHLSIADAAFARDPMPFFSAAKDKHPWLATSDVGYLVTEFNAMDEILRMDGKLRMSSPEIVELMGAEGTGWGNFTLNMMLSKSGPEHSRLRGSVATAFRPNNVNRLRPVMREVVSALLDEWAPKGAFDVAEFAANFPIRVMFGLLGAPIDRLPGIRASLEVQGSSYSLEPERMPEIEASYQVLWEFADRLVRERGTNGTKDDLLDALIATHTAGTLSDDELRIMLIFLTAAGYDTSKNLLTLIMHSMLDAPEVWKRCALDLSWCEKVVKEQLRIGSPSNIYRLITEEFEYRGVVFPVGTMLILPLTISGRDPAVFPNPTVFDPGTNVGDRHLAFGRGMHLCLGQFLAQAQVAEGIHLIARRVTNPRLAGEVTWRPFPGVWGIKSLPIEFEPAPAALEAVG